MVKASGIPGAGKGLFAAHELEEGEVLGWFSGLSRFRGTEKECDEWAVETRNMDTHSLVVAHGGQFHVVDARGSVFAFINTNEKRACNVHVTPAGRVVVERGVSSGSELFWFYGPLYNV